jgi:hypothetical protein
MSKTANIQFVNTRNSFACHMKQRFHWCRTFEKLLTSVHRTAFFIVSVSAIDFSERSPFSKWFHSAYQSDSSASERALNEYCRPYTLQCNEYTRCIAACTDDNNFSTVRRQWKRCSMWQAKLLRVITKLIFAVFEVWFMIWSSLTLRLH